MSWQYLQYLSLLLPRTPPGSNGLEMTPNHTDTEGGSAAAEAVEVAAKKLNSLWREYD
jgi:hypothetical protein